ncbi:DMT family transporter [Caenispirillum bisanense]|uniref:Small multidrug resistance pump n=1 Tax=Caenispirillum bisanense TaxID=414052 RepID=A0A286GVS5_9PROT|nr:multidrug efflux SMR transporter [Caenispirillum bisanense]SOD99134.1 small multidrug resistance pump [Caenispirillum bisanense]
MTWLILFAAIAFEVAGTTSMKLSEGFTRLWPSVALFVCYAAAFALLTLTLRTMGVGLAYAIWSGVGTVATAIIGYMIFQEPMGPMKIACIGLVTVGVVGLMLAE